MSLSVTIIITNNTDVMLYFFKLRVSSCLFSESIQFNIGFLLYNIILPEEFENGNSR